VPYGVGVRVPSPAQQKINRLALPCERISKRFLLI